MAKKRKFIKLGSKAYAFADPWSRFNVSGNQVKELVTTQERRSNKIKNAIRGGHLLEATQAEFDNYVKSLETGKPIETDNDEPTDEEVLREELEGKTKDSLTEYYKSNYEVEEDDITSFSKLNHGDMVEELLELAKPDED